MPCPRGLRVRSAAPLELAGAGVALGKTYPEPVVDHKKGRERALKAYAKVRAS
jgi:deoxyribodipyrimidine photo-lyase